METDIKTEKNSENNKISEKDSENRNKKNTNKISERTAILILSSLVFILIFYVIASRYIELHNNKLSEDYLNITTIQNSEEITSAELRININSNDIYELTQLEGIGKSKAQAIIEYRKENGDFVKIDELKNVSGIGDAIFEKIKNNIYIEQTEQY